MNAKKIAIVAGASGLIGSHLVRLLLEDTNYGEVVTIGRTKLNLDHEKLTQVSFDFSNKNSFDELPQADALFCCLGTTIKKAGSRANFKLVDYHFPLQLGEWGKRKGVNAFHIVSSLGANPKSAVFYSKVKGEIEEALSQLNYPSLFIYQPSLLLGERKENRLGEKVAKVLMKITAPFMLGGLSKYKPIESKTVAKAMLLQSNKKLEGKNVYESDAIENLVSLS